MTKQLTMATTVTLLLAVVFLGGGAYAVFNPTLSVDSCTKSKLIVTLTDGSDSGIIYIQGQGAACKQFTFTGSFTHEFDFGSCGITWEESFKMIVQKKSLYQTGDDKQIPIMCIADLSDITVDPSSLISNDKDDDAGQNLTVKPTAFMRMYSNGDDVSGGNVKLTDVITMAIELDAEFIEDFDIKAKYCEAATIPIIDTSCAADTELFPNFVKPAQGLISATFGAFRTTDLTGGAIGMTFSCTIQVCLGSCAVTTCSDGSDGWGRKKRAISKRAAGDEFEEINVGASLQIAADQVILEAPEDEEEGLCMNMAAFIAVILVLTSGLGASGVAAAVLGKKAMSQNMGSHHAVGVPGSSIGLSSVHVSGLSRTPY